MIVVSDTTPLSELAKIGRLVLLRDVFGQVIVPQEVYDEVTSGTHPAVAAVESATWIEVRFVQDTSQVVALQESTKIHLTRQGNPDFLNLPSGASFFRLSPNIALKPVRHIDQNPYRHR